MSEDKLSCGVVLARAADDGYVTLMLRAWHHWDFPKGLLEEGEELGGPVGGGVAVEGDGDPGARVLDQLEHRRRHQGAGHLDGGRTTQRQPHQGRNRKSPDMRH